MKRLLVLVSSMLFIYVSALGNSKVSCTDKLVADCHPRLILNETEFGQLKKMVEGDNVVSMLHNHLIGVADVSVADEERYISVRRTDGKSTACPILTRIVSCAYAYKMTGQKRYLEKVISDLNDVCSFDGWYVRSYLDVAQVSTAVSIAYDWLCDRLPESVKTKVVHSLKTFALETSRMSDRNEYTWWYKRIGNWNQVCNAGLVCAAFAIYEHCPELAQEVIDDAVRTNKVAVEGIYGPDGAYPEGSSYWHFGSIYQVLLLTLLDDISGTDYGISSSPGFMDTGLFRMFACGSNGCQFNYGDNVLSTDFNYPLFYFAYKRNEPSMLYNEVRLMKKPEYSGSDHCAFLTLAIKYAMRMDLNSLTPPAQKF